MTVYCQGYEMQNGDFNEEPVLKMAREERTTDGRKGKDNPQDVAHPATEEGQNRIPKHSFIKMHMS